MTLELAKNIRQNRTEHKLSQEAFAERIGVSFQTISKWERGECYPDIELLPKIANFFGITIDALLGADSCREKEFVSALQEELRHYDALRDEAALVQCAEDGLKKYPNNHLLMAWIVYGAQNIAPNRSIELGEFLLENCRDIHILNWAKAELCYAYCKAGRREEGLKAASRLPLQSQTRQAVLEDLLDGEEQVRHILESGVAKLGFRFKASVLKLLDHYEPQLQIELLKKSNAVYDAIYETEDCVSALQEKADNCIRMAEIHMQLGNEEAAREEIRQAFEYAQKHDQIPYGTQPKAILCSCEKYRYQVTPSGQLAHPYETLQETLASRIKPLADTLGLL